MSEESHSCDRCGQGDIELSKKLKEELEGAELVCSPCKNFTDFFATNFAYCSNCEYSGTPGKKTSWFKRLLIYGVTFGAALIFDIIFMITGKNQIGTETVCNKCEFENVEDWYIV